MRYIILAILSFSISSCSFDEEIKDSNEKIKDNNKNTGDNDEELIIDSIADIFPKGYEKDFSEGADIDLSEIDKVEIGMSKEEVRKVLGSPTIVSPFHKNRWDYVHNSRIKGERKVKQFTILFDDNNQLIQVMRKKKSN